MNQTYPAGAAHYAAKLTAAEVVWIRQQPHERTALAIASELSAGDRYISHVSVWKIRQGRTYRDVEPRYGLGYEP